MISGTSKIWSKSGPGTLLTVLPKYFKQYKTNYGITFKKYHFLYLSIWHFEKIRFFWKAYPTCFRKHILMCWEIIFGDICLCIVFIIYFFNYFCGDEDWKMIKFPSIKIQKLRYEFHNYQETWNEHLITFLFFCKGMTKLFIFKKGNHEICNSRLYEKGRESSNIK